MANRKPDNPPAPAPDPLFDGAPEPSPTKAIVPQVATAEGAFVGDDKTAVVKQNAIGTEIERNAESSAVAAQVKAMISARTIHALQNPRDFDEARVAILRDCKRPGFAKAAIFRKPVGGNTIEGLSIRFAESALRHWGNCGSESILLYDGDDKRVLRVMLGDFEANVWHSRDITILKSVERSTLKPGQVPISERLNSKGQVAYVVPATEDELQVKEGAARSKVMRNEGLRLIPADILEEALALCRKTRNDEDAKDPDAAKKAVADAFVTLGIMPSDLSEYLGCELAQASPIQVGELREWFVAVRDGDATWSEILQARVNDIAPSSDEKPSSRVADLKARAKAKAEERKAVKP